MFVLSSVNTLKWNPSKRQFHITALANIKLKIYAFSPLVISNK